MHLLNVATSAFLLLFACTIYFHTDVADISFSRNLFSVNENLVSSKFASRILQAINNVGPYSDEEKKIKNHQLPRHNSHSASKRHRQFGNASSFRSNYNHTKIVDNSNGNSSRTLVVGSLTTTPSRLSSINEALGETLNKLLLINKLDRLYFNIPWSYGVRSKSSNVTIPQKLLELVEASKGRLRILRSPDYGPATKLLPTLLLPDEELPSDSIIITFDDDRIYIPNAVNVLAKEAHIRPDSVIAVAAWSVRILSSNGKRGEPNGPNFHSVIPFGREGVQYVKPGPVDIVCGFFGVSYRKRFFEPALHELLNYTSNPAFIEHCMWVDDIWFSGHLERLKVPRYVIGNVPETKANPSALSDTNALSKDKGESVKQNQDNVRCAEAMRKTYEIW